MLVVLHKKNNGQLLSAVKKTKKMIKSFEAK